MRRFLAQLPRRIFLLLMLAGSALITLSSLAYFDGETVPPFVVEKLPVRFERLWLTSLHIHVAAALVALPLCIALMTRALQRRPAWHRWLGRFAGVIVLFALVPSGAVLAFDAKGGGVVTVGFLVSAALVAWFMVRGVAAARRRDLRGHRRAMRHVFAQMSVAVTSRALLFGLDALGFSPSLSYVVALWGPVLVSAGVVELLSVDHDHPTLTLVSRIFREVSDLAVRVRSGSVARSHSLVREGR
jgi:uncharacterized membrane protein YozB (DUF420 family)